MVMVEWSHFFLEMLMISLLRKLDILRPTGADHVAVWAQDMQVLTKHFAPLLGSV